MSHISSKLKNFGPQRYHPESEETVTEQVEMLLSPTWHNRCACLDTSGPPRIHASEFMEGSPHSHLLSLLLLPYTTLLLLGLIGPLCRGGVPGCGVRGKGPNLELCSHKAGMLLLSYILSPVSF